MPRRAPTATGREMACAGAGTPRYGRRGLSKPRRRRRFGRCLQLGGNLHHEELFVALAALAGYYIGRGDLRRAAQVLESLRAGVEEGGSGSVR